jgi:tRNA dimethylallyltransferase
LRGVFEGPPADWEFRRQLAEEAEHNGAGALYERLCLVDPAAADDLHPRDVRRVIRALEVHHRTGRRLSDLHQEAPLPPELRPRHVYWLSPPRDWLYERINRRVEAMFASGLVDEVRRLLAREQPLSRTARQALGYKEVIEALDSGAPLAETIDLIQRRTRQFAKRQHTWFRNLEECRAIEMSGTESPDELAERILAIAQSGC